MLCRNSCINCEMWICQTNQFLFNCDWVQCINAEDFRFNLTTSSKMILFIKHVLT